MSKRKIVIIPGDGIGPEITAAVIKVIEASGAEITWIEHVAGFLRLIVDRMWLRMKQGDYLQIDETPVKVLDPEVKGKAAPWVTEDANAVLDQLRWLNQLSKTDANLVIVASHDEEQHADLVQKKLLTNQFTLR